AAGASKGSSPCGHTHFSNVLMTASPPGKPLTNDSVGSGACPHAIKNTASNKSSNANQMNSSPATTATAMAIPSLVLLLRRPSDVAIERTQLLVQVAEHRCHENVDPAQQVALRDHVIEPEFIKKVRLFSMLSPPSSPNLPAPIQLAGIIVQPVTQI